IVSYLPCACRADEGISGHTVVHCTTDGCRSAWYRPRHYPPDATPPGAAGDPGGEPPSPDAGDPETTEAFDITAITSHPATAADTSQLAGSRSHRGSRDADRQGWPAACWPAIAPLLTLGTIRVLAGGSLQE